MSREKVNALVVMTVGVLIMTLCGTCTFHVMQHPAGIASFAIVVGGGCVMVGLVFLIWGLRLWRSLRPPSDREDPG
ncbi:hypothetical protein [Phenylobacterium sp.]|jgi:hypothetical protein|uniref:hypothetical protein n=1 Tax=Phenylobacterium sp. TaxID=1871053 RepID=UPI002E366CFF|nr:hypothetical protein [Phenylobacterium sp.]HEX3365336.1 hypothetical protein [Phenylobacterium sp.]